MRRVLTIGGLGLGLALGLALALPAEIAGGAKHVQTITLDRLGQGVGGFSGILLDARGEAFTLLSDSGAAVDGRMVRDGGHIVRVEAAAARPLTGVTGRPLVRDFADAEGLAALPDGTVFVSFERDHRILRYAPDDSVTRIAPPFDRRALPANGGIEALAALSDGSLIVLPEGRIGGLHPVWRGGENGWQQIGALQSEGGLAPVGADFGPDGRLYVLERGFAGLGFHARVRRFGIGPAGLDDAETVLTVPLWRHGNLEGLAVWRDAAGAIRLTMVSDDNHVALQRGEIVEYRLPEPGGAGLARTGDRG